MLNITLGDCQPASVDDGMDRDWYGYRSDVTRRELFIANRGRWKLGPRAAREGYVLYSYDDTVVCIAEIYGLEDATGPGGLGRKVIVGRALEDDEPMARRWLGAPARGGFRNPIHYFVDNDEHAPAPTCACGCGEPVAPGPPRFSSGHDQRAIHERIDKYWGSTLKFMEWTDNNSEMLLDQQQQRLARATR